VAFNPEIESLRSYHADATEYNDLVVDQAAEGMRIVEGTNLYGTNANWKIVVENALDGYHGLPLHQTYFTYVKSLGGGMVGTSWNSLPARDLGNGHSVIEGEAPYGRPVARWDPLYGEDARPDIEDVRRRLFDRCGVERGTRIADNMRILCIFPNLMINDILALTVRYVEPVRPDLMHVSAWALAPVEEDGERLRRRIDSYLTFIGPGGFATPDDVEALESCQAGFAALPDAPWSDLSRGISRSAALDDDFGIRTFWRGWHALVTGAWPPVRHTTPEAP
jgi:p-cumate 2,3-dioxygenase alpha subunit